MGCSRVRSSEALPLKHGVALPAPGVRAAPSSGFELGLSQRRHGGTSEPRPPRRAAASALEGPRRAGRPL